MADRRTVITFVTENYNNYLFSLQNNEDYVSFQSFLESNITQLFHEETENAVVRIAKFLNSIANPITPLGLAEKFEKSVSFLFSLIGIIQSQELIIHLILHLVQLYSDSDRSGVIKVLCRFYWPDNLQDLKENLQNELDIASQQCKCKDIAPRKKILRLLYTVYVKFTSQNVTENLYEAIKDVVSRFSEEELVRLDKETKSLTTVHVPSMCCSPVSSFSIDSNSRDTALENNVQCRHSSTSSDLISTSSESEIEENNGFKNQRKNNASSSLNASPEDSSSTDFQLRNKKKKILNKKKRKRLKLTFSDNEEKGISPSTSSKSSLSVSKSPKHKKHKRRKWDESEEDKLRAGVKKFGLGQWKKIIVAYKLRRSTQQCYDKWRNILKYE